MTGGQWIKSENFIGEAKCNGTGVRAGIDLLLENVVNTTDVLCPACGNAYE